MKDDASTKILNESVKYTIGVNIEGYGAKSVKESPEFDSRLDIQSAINSGAKEIYIPFGKTYEISVDKKTYEGKGTGIGIGFKLHDNLKIDGGGTIKAKSNAHGKFYHLMI